MNPMDVEKFVEYLRDRRKESDYVTFRHGETGYCNCLFCQAAKSTGNCQEKTQNMEKRIDPADVLTIFGKEVRKNG